MRKVFLYAAFAFGILLFISFIGACKREEPPVGEQKEAAAEGKIQLKILYAGHPGSEREKDFVEFLNKHFKKVGTADLPKFDGSQSKEFDVTILDYDGDGFEAPRPPIQNNYSAPVVTVSVAGATICSREGLKTGYL